MSTQPHAGRDPSGTRRDPSRTRRDPSRIGGADARTDIGAVGPTLLVRLVMTPLTKILNPVVGTLAGRRHVPMARLHHIGRRTGRSYRTTVGARVRGDVILIPLTFGNQSDWARNVYAAGQCSVHVNGYTIRAEHPRFLAVADVAPLVHAMFNPVERVVFKALGIKQFIRLEPAV
jgi:deazaflavin-dependent oxidoreductase (nitroreductase family)